MRPLCLFESYERGVQIFWVVAKIGQLIACGETEQDPYVSSAFTKLQTFVQT